MKIPTEYYIDVTLAIGDTYGDGGGQSCQIFYTDQYFQTRFYPEKGA